MALFEHWTKMKLASRALRAGRFEEAITLANDPLIREHVRAKSIREKAGRKLLDRARSHRDRNNLTAAYQDVERALADGERSTSAVELQRDLRDGISRRRRDTEVGKSAEREVERLLADARLGEAGRVLASIPDREVRKGLAAELERRGAAADEGAARVKRAIEAGDVERGRHELDRLRAISRDDARFEELRRALAEAEIDALRETIADALRRGDGDGAWRAATAILERSYEARTDPLVERARAAAAERLAEAAATAFDGGRIDEALATLESYRRLGLPHVADSSAARLARALRIARRAVLAERFGEPAVAATLFAHAAELVPAVAFPSSERRRLESDVRAVGDRRRAILDALRRSDRGAAREAAGSASENDESRGARFVTALREGLEAFEGGEIIASSRIRRMVHAGDLDGAVRCCVSLFAEPALVSEADAILGEIDSLRERVERELASIERELVNAETRADAERVRGPLSILRDLDAGSRAVAEGLGDLGRRATALDHLEEGRREEAAGNLDGALRAYRAAAEAVPTFTEARDGAARVAAPIGERAVREFEEKLAEHRHGAALASAEAALAIVELPTDARSFLAARVKELRGESARARESLDEARALYERGELEEALHALDRGERIFPGHPDSESLRAAVRALREAAPTLESIEGRLREGRAEEAGRELAGLDAEALAGHPRVEALRERVDRSRLFDERFVIRVEEGSDYLILTKARVRIGNIMGKDLDLSILASLSSEHAEIRRSQSFHGGFQYEIEAVPGKECRVNGAVVDVHALADGDRVRLGEDFEFVFRVPTPRSRAAVLALADGFEVDGIRHVVLMPPDGKKGRILVGPGADAHIQALHAEDPLEIFRATEGPFAGELVGSSRAGVHVDEEGGGAEARLYPGCHVRSGSCRLNIEGSA